MQIIEMEQIVRTPNQTTVSTFWQVYRNFKYINAVQIRNMLTFFLKAHFRMRTINKRLDQNNRFLTESLLANYTRWVPLKRGQVQ
ncbi:hypothetical protein C1X30_29145 [Pseudomonas sp. FW305-BF6]|nr:hypothetical protein C1X28_28710 [Pseudomonas sp. FW305-BF15]PNB77318.1 hypothetical protein C1X30_29145 [Pseudomonas sp. FW305-BF6]